MKPETEYEIYDLLAKYFAGEADAEEQGRVAAWYQTSPAAYEEFITLQKLWQSSSSAGSPLFDTDLAWKKVSGRLLSNESGRLRWLFKKVSIRTAVAASLGILLALGVTLTILMNRPGNTSGVISFETCKTCSLPDSSEISLKKGASISLAEGFGTSGRILGLTGRAYFDVVRRKDLPFVIACGDVAVAVLGTAFDVQASVDSVVVSVDRGKVMMMTGPSKKILIMPGEKGVYRAKQQSLQLSLQSNPNYSAWQSKTLIFDRTEMSEVVRVLNMVYDQPIRLRKENIGRCRITATFRNETLNGILSVIAETLNLTIQYERNNIVIDGEICP